MEAEVYVLLMVTVLTANDGMPDFNKLHNELNMGNHGDLPKWLS